MMTLHCTQYCWFSSPVTQTFYKLGELTIPEGRVLHIAHHEAFLPLLGDWASAFLQPYSFLLGNLRTVISFHFPFSLSLLPPPSPVALYVLSVKKEFFCEWFWFFSLHKFSNILRARLFGMALVEQLGDDGAGRWRLVVCAACCRVASVCFFRHQQFWRDWLTLQKFAFDVCVSFVLYVCRGWRRFVLRIGFIWGIRKCTYAYGRVWLFWGDCVVHTTLKSSCQLLPADQRLVGKLAPPEAGSSWHYQL